MVKVLFPSRPKKQDQSNNNKRKGIDKQKLKQKKMFFDTIKDMRQMVQKHYGSYTRDTLGMQKKNTKVPYTHLMGRRNKIVEKYNHQKSRSKQQNIQYDSSLKLLNSNIIQQSKRQKDQFEKNKYKYQGEHLKDGKLGKERDGMLTLSKKDILRINGKEFQPKNKHQKNQQFGNNKKFSGKKFKKGKKKGGRRH